MSPHVNLKTRLFYPVVRDGGLLPVRPHAVAEGRPAPLQSGGRGRDCRRERGRRPVLRQPRGRSGRRAEAALVRDDAAGDAL